MLTAMVIIWIFQFLTWKRKASVRRVIEQAQVGVPQQGRYGSDRQTS